MINMVMIMGIKTFLASQFVSLLERLVTHKTLLKWCEWLTDSLTDWVSVSIDFTDATLVSDSETWLIIIYVTLVSEDTDDHDDSMAMIIS